MSELVSMWQKLWLKRPQARDIREHKESLKYISTYKLNTARKEAFDCTGLQKLIWWFEEEMNWNFGNFGNPKLETPPRGTEGHTFPTPTFHWITIYSQVRHPICKRKQKYGNNVTAWQFCQSSNDTFILKKRQTKTLLQTCLLQRSCRLPCTPQKAVHRVCADVSWGKFLFATVPLCSRL